MRRRLLSGVMCAGVLAVAWFGCGCRRDVVTMAGSTAFQPFAEKLVEQFMAENPDRRINVQGGGSAVGIQSALSGAADIGMADLVDLPPEARELRTVEVARDGIAIVVNPANGLESLTADQVRAIFGGEIENWADLGGADAAITVVSREAGSGTRISFEQILGGLSLARKAIVQDSNGTIRETVAQDPNAIGYLSHGLVNERVKQVKVGGALATTEDIQSGAYRLVRPVFLLTRENPGETVEALIAYILSPAGQRTIQDSGLIAVR